MQIYLHLNGEQQGPFTPARVSAKLLNGEAYANTLAWREGMANWAPLNDPLWAELGINASLAKEAPPEPEPEPEPEPQPEPAFEPEPEPQPQAAEVHDDPARDAASPSHPEPAESVPAEPAPEESVSEEPAAATEPEALEEEEEIDTFAGYTEEDFKPPSYDDMESEMAALRAEREAMPARIGERAYEAGLDDEDLEDARDAVDKARQKGDPKAIAQAHASLGKAVLGAGLHDPAIEELRTREREISDRMLNLQAEVRRMGGGKRVKKNKPWLKWVVLLLALLLVGGAIAAGVLLGGE